MYTPKLTILTTTTTLEANTWLQEAIRLAFEKGVTHVCISNQGMSCTINKDRPLHAPGCDGEPGQAHYGWVSQTFAGPVFVREKQLLQAAINNGLHGVVAGHWTEIVPAVGREVVVL